MVTPYLVFHGNCAEVLDFYANVFETEIEMQQPYGAYIPEGSAVSPALLSNWILHAEMKIAGTTFWFADEVTQAKAGSMIRLTVKVPDRIKGKRIFDRLSLKGNVTLPPTETFYSTFHGGVTDQYGVCWNIVADEAP